jgi:anaerobic selenocysteine-containing dehydrogenase
LHDPTALPPHGAATKGREAACCMCACRCGTRLQLRQGEPGPEVRCIEGNSDPPLNQGVICAKGSSGAMEPYSPTRPTRPLERRSGTARGDSHNRTARA